MTTTSNLSEQGPAPDDGGTLIAAFRRSAQTARRTLARSFRPARPHLDRPVLPLQVETLLIVLWLYTIIVLLMVFVDNWAGHAAWELQFYAPTWAWLFRHITHLGSSGWILGLAGTIALAISFLKLRSLSREHRAKLAALHADANFIFFAVAISGVSSWTIKNLIGRARPKLIETHGAFHFDPAQFESAFASFPSGHSSTMGCLGMALVMLRPRWWPLWVTLALIGGLSRILVVAHYPSDVVAGLAFGAGVSWMGARWLARRGTLFRFNRTWLPHRLGRDLPKLPRVYDSAAKPRSKSAIRSSASSSPT